MSTAPWPIGCIAACSLSSAQNYRLIWKDFASSDHTLSHSPDYDTISGKSKICPRISEIVRLLLSCRQISLTNNLGDMKKKILLADMYLIWHYTLKYLFFPSTRKWIFSRWTFEKCLLKNIFLGGSKVLVFMEYL